MSRSKNKEFWISTRCNHQTYLDHYNRLLELSINMFEWLNLPDSVDERFLELCLMGRGFALFFEDPVEGYLALTATVGGKYDLYQNPVYRYAYSAGTAYQRELTNKDSVIIYNNRLRTPSMRTIEMYAERLTEIQRAIDVNVKQQKTPLILKASEEQVLSIKNALTYRDENMPAIITDKSLNLEELMVYPTEAPYVSDKLFQLYRQTWAEAYTFLGVENNVQDKKERLVTGEVSSSLATVEANRLTKLNARKHACSQINKMFSLNIDVQFRQIAVLPNAVDIPSLDESEVSLNGSVYSNSYGDS